MIKYFLNKHPKFLKLFRLIIWKYRQKIDEWLKIPNKKRRLIWRFLNQFFNIQITTKISESSQKIEINTRDISVSKLIFLNEYELETMRFASKVICKGDTVIDIGANIGYYTLLFSEMVGNNGEVHAFEPSKREFYQLCKNVNLNKLTNIYMNNIGVGNFNGFSSMNILDDISLGAYNSINDISHHMVIEKASHKEKIRIIKMDTYLSFFQNLTPKLIKIDVEGYEFEVLKGMRSVLLEREGPCVIFEVNNDMYYENNKIFQQIIIFFSKLNYELFSITQSGVLTPFEAFKPNNCIAMKIMR